MSLDIIEELEKLLELKFTPAMHIISEIEKLIAKTKEQEDESEEEESVPTLNGQPVTLESNNNKKSKKLNKYLMKKAIKQKEGEE